MPLLLLHTMANKPTIVNKKHVAHAQVVRQQSTIIQNVVIAVIVLVVIAVGAAILNDRVLFRFRNVATVNNETINMDQFQSLVKLARVQLVNQYAQSYQYAQMFGSQDPENDPYWGNSLSQIKLELSNSEAIGQKTLDSAIEDLLIRQEVKKRGLTISQEEIEKTIKEQFGYFPDGTPTTAPTLPAAVTPTMNAVQTALIRPTRTPTATATLVETSTPTQEATATAIPSATATATTGPTATNEPTATPITQQGFETQMADSMKNFNKSSDGLTEADYRKSVESYLYRQKLLEDLTKDMKPSQEKVWAQHILVATEDEAKAVKTELAAGKDWYDLAADKSTDTSNKDNGGDLGWFGAGAMVAPFEEAAFALEIGQISEPIKTDFGWHIIRVLGKETLPIDESAFQQMKEKVLTDWLAEARKNATITIDEIWKQYVPTQPTLPGL